MLEFAAATLLIVKLGAHLIQELIQSIVRRWAHAAVCVVHFVLDGACVLTERRLATVQTRRTVVGAIARRPVAFRSTARSNRNSAAYVSVAPAVQRLICGPLRNLSVQ